MSQAVKRAMSPRDRMGRSFGRAAKSSTRRTLYAWFDSSSVPAVQTAMASQAAAAAKWVAMGVPLADFMDAHDIGYERRPWQKTWYKSLGMVDVQEDAMSLQDDPTGPTDADLESDSHQSIGSNSGRSMPLPVLRDLSEKQKLQSGLHSGAVIHRLKTNSDPRHVATSMSCATRPYRI